jgi:hypothetical protein
MSFIVHTIGSGRKAIALAVSLRWVVLESSPDSGNLVKFSRAKTSIVRTQGNVIGASRYTLNPTDPNICGFYNDPRTSGKQDKFAGIYSLSALFLNTLIKTGITEGVSILLMQPLEMADKRVLIIIEDGSVSVDGLLDQTQAIEDVNSRLKHFPDTRLYSQLDELGHPATPITWDDLPGLIDAKDRIAVLKPLPASPWMPLVFVAGIVSAGSFLAYQKLVVEPDAQQKALLEAQKQDKTPAYVLAADQELSNAGWDRPGFGAFISSVRAEPALLKGWKLEQVDCDQKRCKSTWVRIGGTVDQLAKALPTQSVLHGESALEKTITFRQVSAKATTWSRSKLLDYQTSLAEIRPAFQKLANVGINTSIGEPQRWAGVDFTGVSPDSLLSRYPVEVSAPLHMVNEIVDILPEQILIKSFVVAIGDNDVRITLKGAVYVK